MGIQTSTPINEAVFLLHELAPESLDEARKELPHLVQELVLGKEGGISESNEQLDMDRAKFMIRALDAAKKKAERELIFIRTRMTTARSRRLWSQIISLICSSGVLASLAVDQDIATIVSAVLALLASIGVMLAEYQERLLRQGDSDIYEAYEKAAQAAYKADLMCEELRLLIRHKVGQSELRSALEVANALCEELNGWIIKISGSSNNK